MSADEDHVPEHIRKAAFEWRVLIDTGDPTHEEREAFETWRRADVLHADAYDRATSVLAALGELTSNELKSALTAASRQNVKQQTALNHFWRLLTLAEVAAPVRAGVVATLTAICFAIVIGGMQMFQSHAPLQTEHAPVFIAYETARGETRVIVLADGTEATLGADSKMSVSISSTERRVILDAGAALFNTATDPGRPFTVKTGAFTARALGTVFAVRNNGGVMRLAVSEGRVRATYPVMIGNEPSGLTSRRELEAGQQIVATAGRGMQSIKPLQEANFGAWREDRLTYVGATLNELVADANRYSDRNIVLDRNLETDNNMTVTVSFNGRDIDTMLVMLPDMFPVEVDTRSPEQIVIRAADAP